MRDSQRSIARNTAGQNHFLSFFAAEPQGHAYIENNSREMRGSFTTLGVHGCSLLGYQCLATLR